MAKETFEIKTNEGKLTIRTTAETDMEAVSHAYDKSLVHDGDAGSVAPVRELPEAPLWPQGVDAEGTMDVLAKVSKES